MEYNDQERYAALINAVEGALMFSKNKLQKVHVEALEKSIKEAMAK